MLVIVLIGAAGAGAASILGLGDSSGGSAPSQAAIAEIPPQYYLLTIRAAAECPGLPWTVLAGIAKEESDFGRAADQTSTAGALGPMQFLPATFDQYAQPVPPGGAVPPTPWDPTDAVFAAARMLCANGAKDNADLHGAIYAYNHSEDYVAAVLADAQKYAQANGASPGGPLPTAAGTVQAAAIAFAESQLGVPYVWGGEKTGVAFDCSGLIQAAYAAAGVQLPRVATDQYNATVPIPVGAPLLPGDLVFYGTAPSNLEHIGMYIGNGMMIDAPRPGLVVREEPFRYAGDGYAGATRVVTKSK
jgi:cell wall-associated NlpC family hydrolase